AGSLVPPAAALRRSHPHHFDPRSRCRRAGAGRRRGRGGPGGIPPAPAIAGRDDRRITRDTGAALLPFSPPADAAICTRRAPAVLRRGPPWPARFGDGAPAVPRVAWGIRGRGDADADLSGHRRPGPATPARRRRKGAVALAR